MKKRRSSNCHFVLLVAVFAIILIISLPIPVAANIIIIPPEYVNITFDASGGTFNGTAENQITLQTQRYCSFSFEATVRPPIPTKPGYIFAGWYSAEGGCGERFDGPVKAPVNDNMVVYANWEIKSYGVTFLVNIHNLWWSCYDDQSTYPDNSYYLAEYGSVLILPSPPAKTGYQFIGWNSARDGTGLFYNGSDKITETLVLYAQWKSAMCTYYFYDWDGTFIKESNVKYDTVAIDEPTYPQRPGYHFTGWDGTFFDDQNKLVLTASYHEYEYNYVTPGADYIPILDNYSPVLTNPKSQPNSSPNSTAAETQPTVNETLEDDLQNEKPEDVKITSMDDYLTPESKNNDSSELIIILTCTLCFVGLTTVVILYRKRKINAKRKEVNDDSIKM